MNAEVSIIIVNFNTWEVISECLTSLFQNYASELRTGKFEVIVVDNASTDDSVHEIKHKFPMVHLIQNQENVGFARANNQGIRISQGVYVLLLNPDTVVPKNVITQVVDYMERQSQVGVATARLELTNGQLDDASHRGFPTPWRSLTHFSGLGKLFSHSTWLNGYHLGYKNLDKIHEIDACVGAFMCIRRSVGETLNWLDEQYFWYGEDLDFCYRVKQTGYQVVYIPTLPVIHHKGVASGIKKHSQQLSKADRETKLRATRARFAVMRIFYRKFYTKKYPAWVRYLVLVGVWLKEQITFFS